MSMFNKPQGSLAQRAQHMNANRPVYEKKGSKFVEYFRLHTGITTRIQLIPAECSYSLAMRDGTVETINAEYMWGPKHYLVTDHAKNMGKHINCSGGPFFNDKRKREPCLACDRYEDRSYSDINRTEFFGWCVYHMQPYHAVDEVQDGKVKWTNYEVCVGHGCTNCAKKVRTEPGRILPWSMGVTQFNTITKDFVFKAGWNCLGCNNVKTLSTNAWCCGNRECGEPLIDMKTTKLSPDKVFELSLQKARCSSCGETGFMDEIVECRACSAPRRAGLFDIWMDVKSIKVGEGKQTSLVLEDFGLLTEEQKNKKPLDLSKIFRPNTLDEQREMFGVRDDKSMTAGAQPYSKLAA